MAPGVLNPYANRASAQNKRPNRPWDAPPQNQVNRTETLISSNYNQPESDPFDCDIDWDAASRLVDAAECSNGNQGTVRGSLTERTQHPVAEQASASCDRSSDIVNRLPSYHHAQQNIRAAKEFPSPSTSTASSRFEFVNPLFPPNQTQHSLANTSRATQCTNPSSPTKVVRSRGQEESSNSSTQPLPKHQKLCYRDTLTTLRPDAWKKPAASTPPQSQILKTQKGNCSLTTVQDSTSSEEHVLDPRQASLPPQLRFDPKSTAPVEDSYRSTLVSNAALSAPLLNGWTLFPHQRKAILCGILMRRMILALDMGLGKTLIGCVWAKSFVRTMEGLKVVFICPVSLKKEWKRTGEEATGLSVADGESDRDFVNNDVIIVSWAKVPDKLNASKFVVVADEAHTMQSMQAARTKNALHLMESPSCVGVLLLTGTPMKNGKPSNLFPLLKAVRHPLGRNQRMYETHFCAGKEIRLGNGPVIWTATGSSNVSQLRELSQSHLLYLSKETCLKELPPQTRLVKKVPVSSRMQAQHDRALNELAKIYKANMDSRSAVGNDAVLGATQKLRMVSSLAKTDAAIELSLAVLNQEAAIVVFTSFVEVAKTIHKKLMESGWNAELLTGETPAKKRQDMVDNFQKGLSPVFVSTFGAGGVGLTLTAACTIVLVDRPWTPGEANQAEDRVRRIGQMRPVKSIWISAFDLDEKIDALLESKSQTANEVLTGSSSQSSHQHGSIIPLILNTVLTPHLS
ncbi:hypothetical protein FisN_5Lh235 [Fistulifera solaris]|uniref:Uncharacterized protein n=1 Tax=Fistulifera solaris TaxID=1519565 RepID=A0A1Z5JIN1_FISSO|nr:hypothetical protein FisN_5Lh235 [Fistulifera solaris]|eukprot:GAX13870.1 hypothetical protein FisN_5Lh235 [Fistulifera solaris]